MNGIKVGYVRVSSIDQNPERQLEGIILDKKFMDKISGKDTKRPNFEEMMRYLREGDTLLVHSICRLARNLDDLRATVRTLLERGVQIKFIKENLHFTGKDTPMDKLLLSILGAVAEFERDIIKERQREGIELAKQRGIYKGSKKKLSPEQIALMKERLALGFSKAKVARDFNISRMCLYQYLRENSQSNPMAAIHETAEALHRVGGIDKKTMNHFDDVCLLQAEEE